MITVNRDETNKLNGSQEGCILTSLLHPNWTQILATECLCATLRRGVSAYFYSCCLAVAISATVDTRPDIICGSAVGKILKVY